LERWTGALACAARRRGLPPTIAVLTTREGLASNWVNALLEDRDGNIWVATNDGLSLLAPRLLEALRVLDKLGSLLRFRTEARGSGPLLMRSFDLGKTSVAPQRSQVKVSRHSSSAGRAPG